MSKKLQGLVDRNTYEEVPSASVPSDQVQSAPARMVYVVKPALKKDGSRYVKRKLRLVICGNFLKPYVKPPLKVEESSIWIEGESQTLGKEEGCCSS
eukprot:5803827-Amphidinium_carterae.1